MDDVEKFLGGGERLAPPIFMGHMHGHQPELFELLDPQAHHAVTLKCLETFQREILFDGFK